MAKNKYRGQKGPLSRILISILITGVVGFIYFYVQLPAINIHDPACYWFLFLMVALFCVCMVLTGGFDAGNPKESIRRSGRLLAFPFGLGVIIIGIFALGNLMGWEVLRAHSYAKLLSVENGDFAQEVSEISMDQIPLLDEDSANNLANRKLGEISDLVSQFTVSDQSAQINYRNAPVRVTYLDYGSFFKWLNNRGEGIPAYMVIDMRSQDVKVVRLEQGIKYSPSEYFSRDLLRHLRFSYPTAMYGNVNFEVDEEGTPYWVASVEDKTIGLFGGTDVKGAVLMNALTGESQYYPVSEVPSWVDRVYSARLVITQYNYYGKYSNGFWNSVIGQKNCTATTEGYNYIAQDDDVWLYTGITSVTGDRGNIGFILVNQRTKETSYYACAGAEEYSAMSSGEGAVQQYSYTATFPLLLNISDEPTYFMALKDTAGLVKMYAMVNVKQYQIVATGYSLAECQDNYHNLLVSNKIIDPGEETAEGGTADGSTVTASGAVSDIRSAAMDGNTIFFLKIGEQDVYYTVSAKDYPEVVILDTGDEVTLTYRKSAEGRLCPALDFKIPIK